ncbi:MAG: hypothetical protein WC457_02440 [Patescibacteria group bacterium]
MKKQRHVNFAVPTKGEGFWREYAESHGAVSTRAWLVMALIGTVISVILWFFYSGEEPRSFPHCLYYISLPSAIIGYIIFISVTIRYFKRNVIGYELWLFHAKCCNEPLHEEQRAEVVLRGEPMAVERSAVIISLGGWFTRQVRINGRIGGGGGWYIDRNYLKNNHDENNTPSCSDVLIRSGDEAMRVDINTLIGFMNLMTPEDECMWAWPNEFGDMFMRYYRMAINEEKDLSLAVDTLNRTVAVLRNKTRVGISKGAKDIRENIIEPALRELLEPTDPRHPDHKESSAA